MQSFEDILRLYDYPFPKESIAQAPATPRDSAKLLVYHQKAGDTEWSSVRSLQRFLPPRCVLVLNETKVIPARLHLTKATGGRVSVLYVGQNARELKVLANRKISIGDVLTLSPRRKFMVTERSGSVWFLKPSFPIELFPGVLQKHGVVPLPPYINRTPLSRTQLKSRYQTVFARASGSIAAPTASLHFTKRLLRNLERSGIDIVKVTLHVHLGTFSPLTEEQWKTGKLHPESYCIDSRTVRKIAEAKRTGRPVIAVGTTVVRTLESAADSSGMLKYPEGVTRLFIRPQSGGHAGYRFKIVDGMLTNFHVPRSSLLMLVSALTGREKLLELYHQAIGRDFRLFSFGDAMLIIP